MNGYSKRPSLGSNCVPESHVHCGFQPSASFDVFFWYDVKRISVCRKNTTETSGTVLLLSKSPASLGSSYGDRNISKGI